MAVTCTGGDRVLTASVSGEVDHHRARRIMEELEQAIDGMAPRQFTLDLSEVSFMDSSGVGAIMGRYRNIRLVGGVIRAIHVNDRVERLFHLAGIDKVIEIEKEKSWMKAGSQKEDSYGTHQ